MSLLKKICILTFAISVVSLLFYQISTSDGQSKNRFLDLIEVSNLNLTNQKWIVVTSINDPTEQCRILANTSGFQLLVVGDLKTSQYWHLNNTIFLSLNDQNKLGFKSFQTVPFNSYTRKNIGYLFAIQHGAKYIYDTDDDNAPLVNLSEYFSFEQNDYGLIYDCKLKSQILNPYAHFGQPMIWPRGFPLSEIKNIFNNSYITGLRRVSIVQQGVVNGDPDVDAIFRLTKSMAYKKIDLKFDSSAPSFQIPLYKMSPYNSQNTLFSYNAFWSLYLPKTVTFRLTDIWRSYWAQRLMWLIDETVSFNGPNAYQFRNSHSYLKDFEEEKSMYLQTENLVKFLYEWKCSKEKFYECILELSKKMAENMFWEKDEVIGIKNWLDDLNSIGYIEPEIVNFEHNQSISIEKCDYRINFLEYSLVRFTPNFQKSIDSDNYCCNGKTQDVYENFETFEYFKNLCDKVRVPLNYSFVQNNSRVNYSLLVTFNHLPIDENIVILKHIFSGYFQNILFCGVNITNKLRNLDVYLGKKFDSYTFIEMDTQFGSFHHYCMNKAIEMNFNTQGFLLMSDDVFLKYWNLKSLDPNKMWYGLKIRLIHEMDPNNKTNEWWIHWNYGVRNVINVWAFFDLVFKNQTSFDESSKKIIKSYLNFIDLNQEVKSNITKIYFQGSDIFYLPKKKFSDFYLISKIFRMHNLFLEIAVPTILAGLDRIDQIEVMEGLYNWSPNPFSFNNDYNFTHYFHSFKLSRLGNMDIRAGFCSLFLNDKFS